MFINVRSSTYFFIIRDMVVDSIVCKNKSECNNYSLLVAVRELLPIGDWASVIRRCQSVQRRCSWTCLNLGHFLRPLFLNKLCHTRRRSAWKTGSRDHLSYARDRCPKLSRVVFIDPGSKQFATPFLSPLFSPFSPPSALYCFWEPFPRWPLYPCWEL